MEANDTTYSRIMKPREFNTEKNNELLDAIKHHYPTPEIHKLKVGTLQHVYFLLFTAPEGVIKDKEIRPFICDVFKSLFMVGDKWGKTHYIEALCALKLFMESEARRHFIKSDLVTARKMAVGATELHDRVIPFFEREVVYYNPKS